MDWQAVLWTIWMVIFTPTYFLIRLLWWPIISLYNVILTLLAPVICTTKVFVAPFYYVYSLLPRLQPLYLFFGSAAFLGILAGIAVYLTSTVISTVAGMHEEDGGEADQDMIKYEEGSTRTATPTGIKRLDEYYSSQESDWQWLDRAPGPPGDSRRRRKPGLLAQTILEEDDS